MAKAKRYMVRYLGRSIEMSRANSSILIYRIPYQNLIGKDDVFTIENPFIVYVLYGKNEDGKDIVYVGKSKNGIKNRPTSHENKCESWTYCYVLTQYKERTFFNDGTIQYLEDKLNKLVNEVGFYENTTKQTNTGTANRSDEEDCDEYLEEAFQMLDILGLDLITHKLDAADTDIVEDTTENSFVVPDGIYHLKRKMKRMGNKVVKANMQVSNGHFIVLKDSMICETEGPGLLDYIIIKRNNATIVDGILKEDVIFDSPSAAGTFVIGAACNGWTNWCCEDGSTIDKFRNT